MQHLLWFMAFWSYSLVIGMSVCHVFREANSAADYLPNFALILPLGPLVLQDPLAGFVVTVWGWYFLAL